MTGDSPRLTGLTAYVQVLLVAALTVTSSLVYLRFFDGMGFLIATSAAAVLGAAIAALAALRRWGILVSVGLSAVGFALVAVFAVFRDTLNRGIPTGSTFAELGPATVDGWARMLSVSLPANPTGDLVFTPALLTWLAAAASTTVVIRTRAIVAPLLFPLIAFAVGLVFTAERPLGGFLLVAVLLALSFTLVLLRAGMANRAEHAGARALWGHLALGLPVVLVAGAAGVAGSQLLPVAAGEDRFDLRDVVPVELDIGDHLSPLAMMKSQLKKPGDTLFTVRFNGPDAGIDRMRTAALEHYDGALWSSRDKFLLAGGTLQPAAQIDDPQRVSVTVEIEDIRGPYLPSVGAPVELDAVRAGYSAESGVLVSDAPSRSGLRYDLSAEVAGTVGLDKAVPRVTATSERYIDLPPGLPAEVQAKGEQLAGAVQQPFAKLTAIQDHLRSLPYSLKSRPGHSYDSLRRLFSANPDDRVGYAEQFAAAFAVLARSQGFPTRVAVGYLLRGDDRKGDTYTVKSGDAHAWAEVHFEGYGWVAFDPTDPDRRSGTPQDPNQGGAKPKEPEKPKGASQPAEDPNLPNLAAAAATFLDWALWVLIGLGLLVVATPIAIAAEKVRRRRDRRSGSRSAQIIGAWQESADRLVESGLPVTASSTVLEVARHAQEELGEPAGAVAVLAPLTTRAMYSPAEPSEDDVSNAWQLRGRLAKDLRRARGLLRTLRGWVDPRPLFTRTRDTRRRRRDYDRLAKG